MASYMQGDFFGGGITQHDIDVAVTDRRLAFQIAAAPITPEEKSRKLTAYGMTMDNPAVQEAFKYVAAGKKITDMPRIVADSPVVTALKNYVAQTQPQPQAQAQPQPQPQARVQPQPSYVPTLDTSAVPTAEDYMRQLAAQLAQPSVNVQQPQQPVQTSSKTGALVGGVMLLAAAAAAVGVIIILKKKK